MAFYLGPSTSTLKRIITTVSVQGRQGGFPGAAAEDCDPARDDKDTGAKRRRHVISSSIRDEKFTEASKTPIFGQMFLEPGHASRCAICRSALLEGIAAGQWKPDAWTGARAGDAAQRWRLAEKFNDRGRGITRARRSREGDLARTRIWPGIHARMNTHILNIEKIVQPGSEAKAYHLAARDRGDVQRQGRAGPLREHDRILGQLRSQVQALRKRNDEPAR